MEIIRPPRLKAGDRVAVVATSWPGGAVYPDVYRAGLATLREVFGLEVVEYPSTAFTPEYASAHPAERAADLNRALGDPSIHAIVSVIGGDDSVRILPYVDAELAAKHPKVLLGYSDTSTQLFWLAQAGLDAVILRQLAEWGATDIPVLTGADFGHIDPQWILPHNVLAELDPVRRRFRLLEPAVT